MRVHAFLVLAAPVAALACSSSAPPPAGPSAAADAGAPVAITCPDGARASGARCEPVLPVAPCPGGTFARIGRPDCVPVGWTDACPRGFLREPDGFGCEPRGPSPTRCPDATREDVGEAGCVPIGDCDAPFPPTGATLFVDASYADTQLDAKHFRAIPPAVAAAATGATIAVAAGDYRGSVGVLDKSVNLVGRCAARVTIRPESGPTGGIFTNDVLRVRGVTVAGFPGGVIVEGGTLELEDSVLQGNTAVGLYARAHATVTVRRSKIAGTVFVADQLGGGVGAQEGSRVVIEDSAVVDNVFANLLARGAGSSIEARGVVVARNVAVTATPQAAAVLAEDHAQIALARVVVDDAWKFGMYAATGAKITAAESVVRRARGSLAASGGVGVFVTGGGRAELAQSGLSGHPVVGAYADVGGVVALDGVTVRGPRSPKDAEFGRGAQASGGELAVTRSAFLSLPQSGVGVQQSGRATLTDVLVRGSYPVPAGPAGYGGFGVVAEVKSRAILEGVTLEDNALSGLTANQGSVVDARALYVRRTRELPSGEGGSALQVFQNADARIEAAIFEANLGTAVLVATQAKLGMTGVVVRGTVRSTAGTFGHGLTTFDSDVTLDDVAFVENQGIGLAADGVSARVRVNGGVIASNAVGVHAQDGAFLRESGDAAELEPGELRVSPSTVFEGNGAKVGAGTIPLPSVPTR